MARTMFYLLLVALALLPSVVWVEGRALAEMAATADPGVMNRAATDAPAGTFDPVASMPTAGSAEASVRAQVAAGQRVAACREASVALSRASEPVASRLRWHVGHQCDDATMAATALSALAQSTHPLAAWARLDRADTLRRTDPLAAAALLSDLPSDWAGAERARVALALALNDAQATRAEASLRDAVNASAIESGAATVAMPLAALLAARTDEASKLEALALYRRVASRAPLTTVGRQALTQAAVVLAGLPAETRATYALPTLEDEELRARALFNAHRHEDSASVFAAVAERTDSTDAAASCRARVGQLRSLSRARDKRRELVDLSGRVVSRCVDAESRAWSHYYAAQALVRLGEPSAAIARYDQIAVDAPGHSLIDDALFKGAQAATDANDLEGAAKRLRTIVDHYPNGDMHSLARFEIAWRARRQGDHVAALAELDTLLREGTGETAEGVEGRAAYWRARTLASLNRADDAVAGYRALVLSAPLSYYGQQALVRLSELKPAVATELLRLFTAQANHEPLSFRSRPELREPAFVRAVELLAVGEIERARDELSLLGALGEGADPDLLWLVTALFDAADAPAQASRIARDRLSSFTATAPRGRGFSLWRLGYPRAFTPLIDDAAVEAEVPATFVRAVAREESAFDPNAMSSAGAYGLIQLMEATAREHAKGLKLPSDPAALRRPEVNVRIGASFMRYLWKRYADNPAVVPAAYNAGHGAADRWLRERADQALDEWIENIPYDETRRYTRRVLQSYGVYAMLDEGRLPALNAALPRAR